MWCTRAVPAEARTRVSPGGGINQSGGDGRELFFTTPTTMAVAVRTEGDRADVASLTDLFEIQGLKPAPTTMPSADGQRFLVKTPT